MPDVGENQAVPAEDIATIHGLNQAFPNGWRSGDQFTDACTFILARGLRQMLGALLAPRDHGGPT